MDRRSAHSGGPPLTGYARVVSARADMALAALRLDPMIALRDE